MNKIAQSSYVKQKLRQMNSKAKKSLGQNFLVDGNIAQRIVATATVAEGDKVLEIGPGLGVLTQLMVQAGAMVTAVELDNQLATDLQCVFPQDIKVINDDFLAIDSRQLMPQPGYKVVANLPYYITTPIIMKLIEDDGRYSSMTFMVQKEVAERIVAKPGSKAYGILSIAVQYFNDVNIAFVVPPTAFFPVPKISSAVLHCQRLDNPIAAVANPSLFFKIVRIAFGQRRKTLVNTLSGAGFDKNCCLNILAAMELDAMIRGEALSIQQFATFCNKWSGQNE